MLLGISSLIAAEDNCQKNLSKSVDDERWDNRPASDIQCEYLISCKAENMDWGWRNRLSPLKDDLNQLLDGR